MSFTLVPQTDRRQVADRRAFLRGGRRASDVVTREESIAAAQTEATVFWSASQQHDLRTKTEKLRLH